MLFMCPALAVRVVCVCVLGAVWRGHLLDDELNCLCKTVHVVLGDRPRDGVRRSVLC